MNTIIYRLPNQRIERHWPVKPISLSTLLFYRLFTFSLQTWGTLLLTLAILLSSFSWIYLKAIEREQIAMLQTNQQQFEQLKHQWNQLRVKHDVYSSQARIQVLAKNAGLEIPSSTRRVHLPKNNSF